MKPRRAKVGAARKEIQRVADIRQQIANEKAKHAARATDFGLQRAEDQLADPRRRMAREVRRLYQQAEENRRHRAALERLQRRIARR
jgi:hypothetical protein